MASFTNIAGLLFGQLIPIYIVGTSPSRSVIWLCQCECGNTTHVTSKHLIDGNTKGCGCIRRRRGKFHHNYKNGRTRNHVKHAEWRNQVLQRCNYTCDISGKIGGSLQAHHLNGWAWFPKERYDINNGVALSIREHILFHDWLGGISVKCTREDYEIYKPMRIRENMVLGI